MKAVFTILNGEQKGKKIILEDWSCKVIGRPVKIENFNADKTMVMAKNPNIEIKKAEIERICHFLSQVSQEDKFKIDSKNIMEQYKRTNDLTLDDGNISRLHAMIFNSATMAGVIDLASTNGTFLNSNKIDVSPVRNDDIIKVGKTEIVFNWLD